jgi:TetR/AcrR family transcriptional regulator
MRVNGSTITSLTHLVNKGGRQRLFTKFLNLEQEKQDRIINAAIKEFAHKGYEKASTNEIVKEAEISKGLLFHYFGNKKKMYGFLFDYGYELISEEFYKKINLKERDFFTRIREAILVKTELLKKYPELFKFIEAAYFEESPEVKPELEKKIKHAIDVNFGKIYEGVDFSKFREDIDLEKILKIITWTFEKISEEALLIAKLSPEHEMDYEMAKQKAEEYFEVLTKLFYK